MSFAKPAVQASQGVESITSQDYMEIAYVFPSLARALKVTYTEDPQSTHSPAEVLGALERCKTVEGAIIVCSGLYVEAAATVMDTRLQWEQAGRPVKELATDGLFIARAGGGSARHLESIRQLSLLGTAMNELSTNIPQDTTLNFEAQIKLGDASLWRQLTLIYQKAPTAAQFLRGSLHMEINTYGSIDISNPRNHTERCQGALRGQEYKSSLLKNPGVSINRVITEEFSELARIDMETEKHNGRKEANPSFFNGAGKEVWDEELGRLVRRRDKAQKLYTAAKVAGDELHAASGGFSSKQKARRLSS